MQTKLKPCAICGDMVEVSKFLAAAKVRCAKHHGMPLEASPLASVPETPESTAEVPEAKENTTESHRDTSPGINKALEKLACPYGHGPMAIRSVMHDTRWGDKITMQCDKCWFVAELMDKCPDRGPIGVTPDGVDMVALTAANRLRRNIISALAGDDTEVDK